MKPVWSSDIIDGRIFSILEFSPYFGIHIYSSREMGLSEEHSSGSLPFLATSVIQASVNDVESLLSMSESENTSDNLGRSIEENALVLIYCYF